MCRGERGATVVRRDAAPSVATEGEEQTVEHRPPCREIQQPDQHDDPATYQQPLPLQHSLLSSKQTHHHQSTRFSLSRSRLLSINNNNTRLTASFGDNLRKADTRNANHSGLNEARVDVRAALASAGKYANDLHLAADRQSHLITASLPDARSTVSIH